MENWLKLERNYITSETSTTFPQKNRFAYAFFIARN